MWGCALGLFEASAQMTTSPRKEEKKKEEAHPWPLATTDNAFGANVHVPYRVTRAYGEDP